MYKEVVTAKRGQVTMFIIIAIVIVVAGVLVYQFVPGVKESISGTTNPNAYMQNCLEDELVFAVETVSEQGGFMQPKNFYKTNDVEIGYLCYTNEYHKYCSKQVPFLEEHIEEELLTGLQPKINSCLTSLKENFEEAGYAVTINRGQDEVRLLSSQTRINSRTGVTLSKGDTRESVDEISVVYNNNLYELIGITKSIVDFESAVGEAEPLDYMQIYRGIKVEKHKQTDGTKLYIVTNKDTGDIFQFASRSLVLPPGLLDPNIVE